MKRFNLLAIVVMVALASASQAQQYRVKDLGTLGGASAARPPSTIQV